MRHCFRPVFAVACVLAAAAAAPAASGPGSLPDNGEARFQALDGDHDGRVSWDEFHALNSGISRQGFDSIDGNRDGFLSLDEWKAFSANHGMGVTMPPAQSRLPARDAAPPSVPLILPPAGTSAPHAAAPAAPAAPARPEARMGGAGMPVPAGKPALPLVMPPAAGRPEASPPSVAAPAAPSGPAAPLVTPPTPPAPSGGQPAKAQ